MLFNLTLVIAFLVLAAMLHIALLLVDPHDRYPHAHRASASDGSRNHRR